MTSPVIEVLIPAARLAECSSEDERMDLCCELIEAAGADWARILGPPQVTPDGLIYRVPPLNPWIKR